MIQQKLSTDSVTAIGELVEKITDPKYYEKATEVTDLVINRFKVNDQKEGVMIMNETRNLFKAEFEAKDAKIAEQAKQLENNAKQLENKDKQLENKDKQLESKDKQLESKDKQLESNATLIERLKAEVRRLGGNVAMF